MKNTPLWPAFSHHHKSNFSDMSAAQKILENSERLSNVECFRSSDWELYNSSGPRNASKSQRFSFKFLKIPSIYALSPSIHGNEISGVLFHCRPLLLG